MSKRLFCLMLTLCLCVATLSGCAKTKETAAPLSFSTANSIEELNALNGKKVSIIGYMATLSPLSGSYMYLMNMPYQSCPFCVPNTTQLSNTMAVYAKDGKSFEFTDVAIKVTGTLKVEDYEDDFGYTYNYRIVDAQYTAVDLSEVSPAYVLWQTVSQDGLTADVYAMFDYLYFVCCWSDYTITYTDENGNQISDQMWPGDAMNYLNDTGDYGYYQQAYGSYFDELVVRCNAISSTELSDLIEVIKAAKELSDYAVNDLAADNFTYDEATQHYTQNAYDELYESYRQVYLMFDSWMSKFEM